MQILETTSSLLNNTNEKLSSKNTKNKEEDSFDSLIKKEENTVEVEKQSTESLFKDLMSLLKTGYTEGELKNIEEILRKLATLRKNNSSGNNSLSNIEDQIKQLRQDLKLAQQEATGRTVQDINLDDTNNSLTSNQESKLNNNSIKNLNSAKDGSVLKENQLLFASVSEQLKLLASLNQSKK
jgi:Mg2+ and Co2+ transporter CorA